MKFTHCPHCQTELIEHHLGWEPPIFYWKCENLCPINFHQYRYHFYFCIMEYKVMVYSGKLKIRRAPERSYILTIPAPTLDFSNIDALHKKIKIWLTFS